MGIGSRTGYIWIHISSKFAKIISNMISKGWHSFPLSLFLCRTDSGQTHMDPQSHFASLRFASLCFASLLDSTRLDSTRLDSTRLDSTRFLFVVFFLSAVVIFFSRIIISSLQKCESAAALGSLDARIDGSRAKPDKKVRERRARAQRGSETKRLGGTVRDEVLYTALTL